MLHKFTLFFQVKKWHRIDILFIIVNHILILLYKTVPVLWEMKIADPRGKNCIVSIIFRSLNVL